MLRLNETNVEVLKFLTAEQCDPIRFVSRRARNIITAHAAVLPLRNLNLSVDQGAYLENYSLSYNTNTGLRTHDYQRQHYPDGLLPCGRTETERHLEPFLKGCWVSYIAIRSEVCFFIEL